MEIKTPVPANASVFADAVGETSIRLLRFSQREDGVFIGKLRKFPLANAPHYYTASYVWGERKYTGTAINLETGTLPVLNSLAAFLHMISQHGDFKPTDWWWIDSLCINLIDSREREKQVRIMADIYKRTRRAIVWLGEEKENGSDCTNAISFLHHLSSLQVTFNENDQVMRSNQEDLEFTQRCAAVSSLLARPWWTRVWTLQEFVLPKEVRLYCGTASISRGRFKSAIYNLFLCSTVNNEFEHEIVPRNLFDGAFNRRRIHQWHSKADSIGINLIAIMAYLGNHSATDSRDRIYSVLGLITEQDRKLIGPAEYSTSIEHQFAKLVCYFWTTHASLDIICFAYLFCRYAAANDTGRDGATPTWAPDWRITIEVGSPVPLMASQSACGYIGNFRPVRSTHWEAIYDAPGAQLRKKANVSFSEDINTLYCNGALLDMIHGVGGLDTRELRCRSFVCSDPGHSLVQSPESQRDSPNITTLPMEWLEAIARALVIDWQDKHLCFQAPMYYIADFLFLCHSCIDGDPVDWSFSSWFELNRQLKFGNYTLEDLINQTPPGRSSSPSVLQRPPSHPMHQMHERADTFLSRFHDTVRKKARRLMVTEEGYVGVAPCRARPGDMLAILYGCSIPLVLREDTSRDAWQVVGEAYVHGHMNGEVTALVETGEKTTSLFRVI